MEMNKTLASSGGRITVIDALRGFSLIGICLIHGMQHFGAMGTMAPQAMFPWEGTLDEIFRWFINYLVFGKFFIIFSCLFGASLSRWTGQLKKVLISVLVSYGDWYCCL